MRDREQIGPISATHRGDFPRAVSASSGVAAPPWQHCERPPPAAVSRIRRSAAVGKLFLGRSPRGAAQGTQSVPGTTRIPSPRTR